MKKDSRFVLDTNSIVSGLIYPRSIPRQAVDTAFKAGTVLSSVSVTEELFRVLGRPKMSALVDSFELEEFFDRYIEQVEIVNVQERITVCRDPRDDKFLELAVAGMADYIVTGDNDLLCLDTFRDTVILNASDFVQRIK